MQGHLASSGGALGLSPGVLVRESDASYIAQAAQEVRRRTVALVHAFVDRLGPELAVPYHRQINPPRWEAGHVAWFWDYWVARNNQRQRGIACEPNSTRLEGRLPGADELYNSSEVPHAARWHLPLPDVQATLAYLDASLNETLALLSHTPPSPNELYFYRLALLHEDMHAEAFTYGAQALDIPLPSDMLPKTKLLPNVAELPVAAGISRIGSEVGNFAFDNELKSHEGVLPAYTIDSVPVSWRRYLPAVETGVVRVPRYLVQADGTWLRRHHGSTEPIDLDSTAVHIDWYDADRWCKWAGRRLPTESEWERACAIRDDYRWGTVWEWTATRFAPFDGFIAHPYRDYSRFGFESETFVLKGAGPATHPRIAHPKYRNFFAPDRDDIHAGFRTCAL